MSHVPDVAVAAAAGHNSTRAAASGMRQSTNEVFMVAPTAFGFNDQARAPRRSGRGRRGPGLTGGASLLRLRARAGAAWPRQRDAVRPCSAAARTL